MIETMKPVMHLWIESRNIEIQGVAGTESRICSFRDGSVHETAWENYADIEEQYPVILKVTVLSGVKVHEFKPVDALDAQKPAPKLIPFDQFVDGIVRYSFSLEEYVISTNRQSFRNADNPRKENPEIVIRYMLEYMRPGDMATVAVNGHYSGDIRGRFVMTKTMHTDGLEDVEYTVSDELRDMLLSYDFHVVE